MSSVLPKQISKILVTSRWRQVNTAQLADTANHEPHDVELVALTRGRSKRAGRLPARKKC